MNTSEIQMAEKLANLEKENRELKGKLFVSEEQLYGEQLFCEVYFKDRMELKGVVARLELERDELQAKVDANGGEA